MVTGGNDRKKLVALVASILECRLLLVICCKLLLNKLKRLKETLIIGSQLTRPLSDLPARIIQDFNLSSLRVYTLTAKFFINESRIDEVEKLLQAIAGNGGFSGDAADTAGFCDELIRNCVEMAIGAHGSSSHIKSALEALIKRVADVGTKIHCYCVTGQLKSAYLLANRTGRLSDVRKILRQAEVLNQGHVKRLCQAKLAREGGSGGSGSAAMGRKTTG